MNCAKCEKKISVGTEVEGKTLCLQCFNPFRRCRKCGVGQLTSKPTPNWMNRWQCDRCKKCMSR